jgi:cytoskeletal protein CcmA (bactofilin family)
MYSKETVVSSRPLNLSSPIKSNRAGTVPSVISAGLTVTGNLTSVGDVQMDGCIEGDVRGARLVIGDQAEVHGNVYAEEVTVRGIIFGRIFAQRVLLSASSRVTGEILYQTISVELGASFEGSFRRSDSPLSDASCFSSDPAVA